MRTPAYRARRMVGPRGSWKRSYRARRMVGPRGSWKRSVSTLSVKSPESQSLGVFADASIGDLKRRLTALKFPCSAMTGSAVRPWFSIRALDEACALAVIDVRPIKKVKSNSGQEIRDCQVTEQRPVGWTGSDFFDVVSERSSIVDLGGEGVAKSRQSLCKPSS